jgi:hypothetical protein
VQLLAGPGDQQQPVEQAAAAAAGNFANRIRHANDAWHLQFKAGVAASNSTSHFKARKDLVPASPAFTCVMDA